MIANTSGTLARVIWTGADRYDPAGVPKAIMKLANGTTVIGKMALPVIGDNYRFWGSMVAQRGRDEEAFEFSSFDVLVDESIPGIVHYLKNHVPGVGAVKGAVIAEHFGVDTLKILREDPDRIGEVAGISESLAATVRLHFEEHVKFDPVAYSRLIEMFEGFKIARRVIEKLLKDFGSSAPSLVAERPYSILLAYPRMGWETVDRLALDRLKYDPMGPDRHGAAILEALERISQNGHTYGTPGDVEAIAFGLLRGMPTRESWEMVIADKLVRVHNNPRTGEPQVCLPKIAEAEEYVARKLVHLSRCARPLFNEWNLEGLSEEQAEAVKMIDAEGVAIVTGSPGVGKSFLTAQAIKSIVQVYDDAGGSGDAEEDEETAAIRQLEASIVRVVAPTGKAAKRAMELLRRNGLNLSAVEEVPSTTIHRALAPTPSEEPEGASVGNAKMNRGREAFAFGRNESNPLECDLLVCDEASMLDARLAASMLRAVAPGTRVLFVGDENQLPSVGPGSVLRDMLAAGLPSVMLKKIQRSDSAGRVVHACHAIKDGKVPSPSMKVSLPRDNWVHIELNDPAEIAKEIISLHTPMKSFPDLMWDFQVVTPQKAFPSIGCFALNRELSYRINPPDPSKPIPDRNQSNRDGEREPEFREGDKVVRNKNGLADQMIEIPPDQQKKVDADWRWRGKPYSIRETPIVNGDTGIVRGIEVTGSKAYVVVEFRDPERLVRLPFGDAQLSLAYALTCHKMQGSGSPVVIMPIHPTFYWDERTRTGLWNREQVYTEFSRTEGLLITVGPISSLATAIGRKTVNQRKTRLADLIRRERVRATDRERCEEEVAACAV